MKKMTKKQAIKDCKELWKAIEKSGLSKSDFLRSEEGEVYDDRNYFGGCPLCEYTRVRDPENFPSCSTCPLVTKYSKRCDQLGYTIIGSTASEEFFAAVRGL